MLSGGRRKAPPMMKVPPLCCRQYNSKLVRGKLEDIKCGGSKWERRMGKWRGMEGGIWIWLSNEPGRGSESGPIQSIDFIG